MFNHKLKEALNLIMEMHRIADDVLTYEIEGTGTERRSRNIFGGSI
jgi:hypothetical protein